MSIMTNTRGLQFRSIFTGFRRWGWVAIVLFLMFSILGSTYAEGASSIAQGFNYDGEGQAVPGTLVSANQDNPNSVVPSSLENADLLLGVVGQGSTLELSDEQSNLQVVRSGVTPAIVSDINGNIQVGDRITASPIEGVGMKSSENGVVVGVAQASLDSVDVSEREITDVDGNPHTVRIGLIPVQIETIFYAGGSATGSTAVPGFLQDVANTVAGKQVSALRVIIAAILLLLVFASITVLLYAATKSSIISIGRNPLSEKSVRKSLLQVGITSVGILAFAVILIYLVLVI